MQKVHENTLFISHLFQCSVSSHSQITQNQFDLAVPLEFKGLQSSSSWLQRKRRDNPGFSGPLSSLLQFLTQLSAQALMFWKLPPPVPAWLGTVIFKCFTTEGSRQQPVTPPEDHPLTMDKVQETGNISHDGKAVLWLDQYLLSIYYIPGCCLQGSSIQWL